MIYLPSFKLKYIINAYIFPILSIHAKISSLN